jgi:hypothetical protein
VKHKDLRPWLSVIAGGESLVSHAGGVLLVETAQRSVWVPRTVSWVLISAFAATRPHSHGAHSAQHDRRLRPSDSEDVREPRSGRSDPPSD